MNDPASPTVRRRRLAAELRALRENANRSGDAVANALGWSPSKISRYERAKTGLRPREVERLLEYYKVRGEKRAALLALAEDASQKGWWEEYASSLPEDYQEYIGLEHEASTILIWHVDVVPGLLQTEGYARHIISSYGKVEPVTPSSVGRLIRVRMRQQVLDRDDLEVPPQIYGVPFGEREDSGSSSVGGFWRPEHLGETCSDLFRAGLRGCRRPGFGRARRRLPCAGRA